MDSQIPTGTGIPQPPTNRNNIIDVYPPVADFCDYCGCSARVFLTNNGLFVCNDCFIFLYNEEPTENDSKY